LRSFKTNDGDFKGHNGLAVVPPSIRGGGFRYRWEIDPGLEFPEIDPEILTEKHITKEMHECNQTAKTEHILFSSSPPSDVCLRVLPVPDVGLDGDLLATLSVQINKAVQATIPKSEGRRNQSLYRYARRLKEFMPDSVSEGVIRELVRRWYIASRSQIRTKDYHVCLTDFMAGWYGNAIPHGAYFRALKLRAEDASDSFPGLRGKTANDIARVLREAGEYRGRDPGGTSGVFHMDYRRIAEAVGVSPSTAYSAVNRIVEAGLVRRVSRGSANPKDGLATEYVWVGTSERGAIQ
jgi:hypothetical protein